MKRKIAVIVPVFNAAKYVARLIETIEAAYPEPIQDLRFVFTDDASPEKANATLYAKEAFFKRKDVTLVRHKKNKGYTININGAIRKTADNEDVVLLNSDTEIGPGLFEHLQSVALDNPLCGSVTPLTNLGTIASLFNWPHGGDWYQGLDVTGVNEVLAQVRLERRLIQIPTPIGFCTYLPKRALATVGLFDEELFPRGYGEENDWAMRASRHGFVHHLTLGACVVHASGKSFKETKNKLITAAMKTIGELYPNYHHLIAQHVRANEWEHERLQIMLALSKARRMKTRRKAIAYVLHHDPHYFAGGVEVTVKAATERRIKDGYDVIQIFPVGERMQVRYQSSGKFAWEMVFERERRGVDCLKEFLKDLDVLHTHHIFGVWPELLLMLSSAQVPEKIISLHDYWSICPSFKLLNDKLNFCGVPKDTKSCDKCLKATQPDPLRSIQGYRVKAMKMLLGYDRIEVPSSEARELVREGFARVFKGRDLLDIVVVPNFVPKFEAKSTEKKAERNPEKKPFRNRVIFLGAMSTEKGGEIVDEILPKLEQLGFETEIWGLPGVIKRSPLTVTSYKNSKELHNFRHRAEGAIVCIPSVWPETFSYTFYEAVSILKAPVVVGPFGHPATVTKDERLGEVMTGVQAKDLQRAIEACAKNYSRYQEQVTKFEIGGPVEVHAQ